MTSRFSSALMIGVFGALSAVAWAGCGLDDEGSYYCDDTGCFTCDAYGCSRVNPPKRASCTGNSSCKPGEVCTASGCTTPCETNASCPRGETCQKGFCSPPDTAPGPVRECTTKSDCAGNQACKSGRCVTCGGNAGPCPCETTPECGDGLVCVGGSCTAPENTCKYSSECAGDKVCADGECLDSCAAASCGDGFTCDRGVCKPGRGEIGCSSDEQCTSASAPKCSNGSCVKFCNGDTDCVEGRYCNQGVCAIDTRPKPSCTTNEECGGTAATPKKCLGGFCKFTCTTHEYCRTVDNRIGYCARDGVCRTSAEANAECTGPGDCPSGQSCVDNDCR